MRRQPANNNNITPPSVLIDANIMEQPMLLANPVYIDVCPLLL